MSPKNSQTNLLNQLNADAKRREAQKEVRQLDRLAQVQARTHAAIVRKPMTTEDKMVLASRHQLGAKKFAKVFVTVLKASGRSERKYLWIEAKRQMALCKFNVSFSVLRKLVSHYNQSVAA